MSGNFEVTISTQDVIDSFQSLQYHLSHVKKLMRKISGIMGQASDRAFENEKDPETGQKWKNWSPSYTAALAKKGKSSNKKLQDKKELLRETLTDYNENEAVIGNKLEYARIHQLGGEAGPETRRVDIPARPYIGLDNTAQKKIEKAVEKYLDEAKK